MGFLNLRLYRFGIAVLAAAVCLIAFSAAQASAALTVTRATLQNGLKVVVVHDPLAPAVTAVLNYRVGSDEQSFPGQAHALEHMMFRGSKTLSESQLSDIGELMGGNQDADTQGEITQYFFSVPAQYLDVALRLEASRARGLLVPQKLWTIERGAIKNEVTQDDSIAIAKLFSRTIIPSIFKGTAYSHDTLGTLYSFDKQINSKQLLALYNAWYHPNNAVYVIAGDVDGPATLKAVAKYFNPIPASKLPARPKIVLRPVKAATYTVDSDQPYDLIATAYRLPGYNSGDYAAAQILESVLNNQRGNLYGLVASGKALYAGLQDVDSHPSASAAAAFIIVPVTANSKKALADLTGVLDDYRKSGVPAELVAVAKQRAVANAEFRGNSIDGLAFEWSDAVAKEGRSSPDDVLSEIKAVTVDDVNRVLRTYMVPKNSITAFAIPKNLGKVNTHSPSGPAKESNKVTLDHHDTLPAWAVAAFKDVRVPTPTISPVVSILPNGIRLIVQPETITYTVVVRGSVRSNEAIQAPADKLGVGDIAGGLFSFGTASRSRLQLREQLDKIAAEANAGSTFSLDVLSSDFESGLQLLADEELHPAFPEADFATVKSQTVGGLTGEATAPAHLSEVALSKALYPAGDPQTRYATPATAGAVTLPDVRSYFTGVYRPDMTTIVVIGDTTPAAAKALVEKYFGAWAASGVKPDVYLPAVAANPPADINVPDQGRVQSQVRLAQVNSLNRENPDWANVQLGNTVLGSGGSSILFHDLRDRHGYVYSVGSQLSSHKNRSTFSIVFSSDPNKIVPAQRLALADLRRAMQAPIAADDLQRGKAMLIGEIPLRTTSYEAVASELINLSELGLPLDQPTIEARRELAATGATVRAAMAKWIRPGDFVRVIQGPAPR
ncbi:MAG: insulinase family protein [Candidatus Eremiobacteraeota bacterium]|nr:insulinase family protein [Candidatus Eremiobacteraeota bacterium]